MVSSVDQYHYPHELGGGEGFSWNGWGKWNENNYVTCPRHSHKQRLMTSYPDMQCSEKVLSSQTHLSLKLLNTDSSLFSLSGWGTVFPWCNYHITVYTPLVPVCHELQICTTSYLRHSSFTQFTEALDGIYLKPNSPTSYVSLPQCLILIWSNCPYSKHGCPPCVCLLFCLQIPNNRLLLSHPVYFSPILLLCLKPPPSSLTWIPASAFFPTFHSCPLSCSTRSTAARM